MWWRASAEEMATGDPVTPAFETPRILPSEGTERPGARMRAGAASSPGTRPAGSVARLASSPTDRTKGLRRRRAQILAAARHRRFLAKRFCPSNIAKADAREWARLLAAPAVGAEAAR